ncbi:MAG: hypothetical protein GY801_21595 [bacterium]|nr:hypothetical protein [bacterium]
MMNTNKAHHMFLILLFSSGFLVFFCQDTFAKTPLPKVVDGRLDHSEWDFERDGLVKLDGEWEFYWKQLLIPEDFTHSTNLRKTGLLYVPDSWNGYQTAGRELDGNGYATFRVTVHLPRTGDYALKLSTMSATYMLMLWWNHHVGISKGTIGTSKEEMAPRYDQKLSCSNHYFLSNLAVVGSQQFFALERVGFCERQGERHSSEYL